MSGVSRDHHADAARLRETNRMIAADAGDELADAVAAVVDQAASILAGDAAGRVQVDVSRADLLAVPDQELYAVRIDAAKIGGDQRIGYDPGGVRRHSRGFEDGGRESAERRVVDDNEIVGHRGIWGSGAQTAGSLARLATSIDSRI